jgi:hypothetical protein
MEGGSRVGIRQSYNSMTVLNFGDAVCMLAAHQFLRIIHWAMQSLGTWSALDRVNHQKGRGINYLLDV